MKSTRSAEFPIQVKRGSVAVRIYKATNQVGQIAYDQFTVVHYEGAKRKRKTFAEIGAAKREAELIATRLAAGEGSVLRLTSTDRDIYLDAVKRLDGTGVALNLAVLEYTSAIRRLPNGASLKEAVDYFARRHPTSSQPRTVQQVADEMLAAKRAANLSSVHLKDLECRLKRLAQHFQMNVGSVSGSMVQTWLDGLGGSGRTKLN